MKFLLHSLCAFLVSSSAYAELDCSVTSYYGGSATRGDSAIGYEIELSISNVKFFARENTNGSISMMSSSGKYSLGSFDGMPVRNTAQILSVYPHDGSGKTMLRMHCFKK